MCEKSSILTLLFILKIVVLLIIPIIIIFLKKISFKKINVLFYIEIITISVFIILRLINNDCILNSNISGIKNSYYLRESKIINESNDPNEVNRIVTNQIYKSNIGNNVYYFNNNQLPLSNKKIICNDNSEVYMKNYGNSITSISMLLSSYFDKNIDPIEILNMTLEDNIFSCINGVNFNNLITSVSNKYGVNFVDVSKVNLYNEVSNGNIILAEVNYSKEAINVTCDKGYIIIYNVDNNQNFHILYSNDSSNDIICSDISKGTLSTISKNLNLMEWNINNLYMISERFIKIEGR